ncbi:hypothetical protein AB0I28_35750 [Phytomonospora sp. NPDC050363]|uniref:hypothetical protein n=1 Tax=Phytomonospora sp. NPDC050363 TaxID=3155642 RepID=UPI0033CB430D
MPLTSYLNDFVPPLDPSILSDASGLVDDPRFWSAFLYSLGGSPAAVDAFDVDRADVEELLGKLSQPESWPVISIDLSAGSTAHIVFRNCLDDAGSDYVVTGPEIAEPITAVCLDGNFIGPALSWTELVGTAQRHTEKLGPAERLLLLLPATGDADTPPEAVPLVAAAITAVRDSRLPWCSQRSET